jgi:hypothetical protein
MGVPEVASGGVSGMISMFLSCQTSIEKSGVENYLVLGETSTPKNFRNLGIVAKSGGKSKKRFTGELLSPFLVKIDLKMKSKSICMLPTQLPSKRAIAP